MAENLVIVPEALDDIAEAVGWYEGRSAGLGDMFLRRVESCIESIRQNPEMYTFAHESYRRALVRKFPYVIFYEYGDDLFGLPRLTGSRKVAQAAAMTSPPVNQKSSNE